MGTKERYSEARIDSASTDAAHDSEENYHFAIKGIGTAPICKREAMLTSLQLSKILGNIAHLVKGFGSIYSPFAYSTYSDFLAATLNYCSDLIIYCAIAVHITHYGEE